MFAFPSLDYFGNLGFFGTFVCRDRGVSFFIYELSYTCILTIASLPSVELGGTMPRVPLDQQKVNPQPSAGMDMRMRGVIVALLCGGR